MEWNLEIGVRKDESGGYKSLGGRKYQRRNDCIIIWIKCVRVGERKKVCKQSKNS